MRLRALAVTTALALAATGLSACTSKIGQAAVVGSHRISQKDVDRYLNPAGPTPAALAQQSGAPLAPRVFIVDTLVQRELFRAALTQSNGGKPLSAGTIRAAHDDAATKIIGAPIGGAEFDKEYTAKFVSLGYRASIEPIVVEAAAMEYLLVTRLKITTLPQLIAVIGKANKSVTVSPRYGAWDPKTLSLSTSASAGLPSFVTIGSDTQASTSSSPAAGQ